MASPKGPRAGQDSRTSQRPSTGTISQYLTAHAPHAVFAFRILIHMGPVIGELETRTVRHCLLDRNQPRIDFRRTKTTTQQRLVPIPSELVEESKAHIQAHALEPGALLLGMFRRSDVERLHRAPRKAIGRPELRIKDLRHIAAISWRRGGVELQTIRDWLGHKTINQTVVYDAFAPDDAYDAPKVARAAATLTDEPRILPFRAAS